jgi:hypothetical protein
VAYLAHSLVSNARDEGISARSAPGRRRSGDRGRSRATTVNSQDDGSVGSRDANGYGNQALAATASLGRSLLSSVSNATVRGSKAIAGSDDARPSLLNRVSSNRPFPTTAVSQPLQHQGSGSSAASPSEETPLPSVELSSIVSEESKPPTVMLSRQNLGTFFQSAKAGRTRMQVATRFNGQDEPLVDRYGFECK